MKTTLELPDDLLIEAKAAAARRRTTLRAIVEHALRREICVLRDNSTENHNRYEKDELGFFFIKKRPDEAVSAAKIRELEDELEAEEFDRVQKLAGEL